MKCNARLQAPVIAIKARQSRAKPHITGILHFTAIIALSFLLIHSFSLHCPGIFRIPPLWIQVGITPKPQTQKSIFVRSIRRISHIKCEPCDTFPPPVHPPLHLPSLFPRFLCSFRLFWHAAT